MPSYIQGRRSRKLDDAEVIKLYVEDGLDAETIGFRAGCSGTTILNIIRAAGHPVRNAGRGAPRNRRISDDEIIARYREGQSGPAIADAAGCTAGTIYSVIRKAGLQPRPSASGKGKPRNG